LGRAILALIMCALAEGKSNGPEITVHLRIQMTDMAQVPNPLKWRAMRQASLIFEAIGVGVEWIGWGGPARTNDSTCGSVAVPIRIELLPVVPKAVAASPGAVAVADLQRRSIILFYDRIRAAMDNSRLLLPTFMGYVLAHEVAHVSQGTANHAASGVMKAKWSLRDYLDMKGEALQFMPADIKSIQAGLTSRSGCAESSSAGQPVAVLKQ
jgi:hypothetical protein